jgi:AcrR family transcriptional regulator
MAPTDAHFAARPRPRPREGSARERLLGAALARFADEAPVAVSLEDIRRDAGVSVGALYHHFPDKAALVDALYLELTRRVQEEFVTELRAQSSAEDGVKAIVRLYLRWVSSNRAAAGLLLGHRPDERALRDLNRPFFAEVMSWWRTHAHYGALRPLPLELINALWIGPAQEYTRHWLSGRVKRVPRAVADVLADAAWNALKEPS